MLLRILASFHTRSFLKNFCYAALVSLMLPFCLLSAEKNPIPLFDPPSDWECALADKLSPCVQIGFLGKGSTAFRPSINLAIEEVDVGLKQYVKAVKEIHLAQTGTTWRDLGKFKTRSGEGRLTEIGSTTPLGPIKMLQMILVSNNNAYILTGASTKDDFLRFQEPFIKAFQSLRLTENLFSPLPVEKKAKFETFFSKLGESIANDSQREAEWSDLQRLVIQEAPEMGTYWQFLVWKSGREKIYR